MSRVFYIVGPTATGKSEIAVEVALACGGEIVGADAFQMYEGLELLTAKPDRELQQRVRHHLVGTVSPGEELNAERFRSAALGAIADIHSLGKPVFVVGGSGLYVKALTHGLSRLPAADANLRAELEGCTTPELFTRLEQLDAATAASIDGNNRRRIVRALEICLGTGRPASELRDQQPPANAPAGVCLLRDRAELYERINSRVEAMFANGVVDEVRNLGDIGPTAAQTLGLQQICELLAGNISEAECIASIQQATRRYAKRQLTWFARQTSFEPLNLSRISFGEAVECISRRARLSFADRE
ncbi:MAG TPA: tRNA (adenosine(37)-N6)-dimethylallyltransferase MiaA [Chthoniobacterales bacterium]|nr:tRNA (adenosine(37)-N6)-dimethylallyltransferase MiaA [Chthoniobacterales bacterium]